jgi:hypothetical protein
MNELNIGALEAVQRKFAAATPQVIEHGDLVGGAIALQHQREARTYEAGSAGD